MRIPPIVPNLISIDISPRDPLRIITIMNCKFVLAFIVSSSTSDHFFPHKMNPDNDPVTLLTAASPVPLADTVVDVTAREAVSIPCLKPSS